jgi:hypothetical protein
MNIDFVAIGLGENPVGFSLLAAEKVIKSPMEGNGPLFIARRPSK